MSSYPCSKQYWRNIGPVLDILAQIGQWKWYCANIGAIYANIGQHFQCCTDIGENILRQYRVTFIAPIGLLAICGLRWPMKVILRQYRGNICNIGQHYQCCINIGSNILRQYRKTFIAPTFMRLGAVVRASDSWSTGCEFDSRPCTAGRVNILGWVTVCWWV